MIPPYPLANVKYKLPSVAARHTFSSCHWPSVSAVPNCLQSPAGTYVLSPLHLGTCSSFT